MDKKSDGKNGIGNKLLDAAEKKLRNILMLFILASVYIVDMEAPKDCM